MQQIHLQQSKLCAELRRVGFEILTNIFLEKNADYKKVLALAKITKQGCTNIY